METAVSRNWMSLRRRMLTKRSAEEDPDDYPFPLTLRTKQPSNGGEADGPVPVNGN